jgi:hypothetical protein
LLAEVVQTVEAMEKSRWGASAYPYRQPNFPYTAELALFPTNLAQAALSEQLNLTILDDPVLLHEWTLKAGIRLYNQILTRIDAKTRQIICSDDGPYGYVKDKKPLHDVYDALIPLVLTAAFSDNPDTQAVLIPVGVCAGVILAKKGLRSYCEMKGGKRPSSVIPVNEPVLKETLPEVRNLREI